jgi:hypothetical protein
MSFLWGRKVARERDLEAHPKVEMKMLEFVAIVLERTAETFVLRRGSLRASS